MTDTSYYSTAAAHPFGINIHRDVINDDDVTDTQFKVGDSSAPTIKSVDGR
jgi:hypothetical protein